MVPSSQAADSGGEAPPPHAVTSGRTPRTRILAPLAVLLFGGLALWQPAALEEQLENRLVDVRFKLRNAWRPPAVPPNVVIVAIDDQSVARHGSWPWPRERIAELIGTVALGRPRAIGVDLLFAEPESAWADARLAQALRSAPRAAATLFALGGSGAAPTALPPPEPIAAAAALGHGERRPDRGGTLRRELLYVRAGGANLPSFALQTARIAAGLPPEQVRVAEDGAVALGATRIPADRHGRMLVNYYGGEGAFPRHSAAALLSDEMSGELLAGAVVFIGTTGIATYDLVRTPFAESMAAVEKDATVAANIIARDFLRDAPAALDLLAVILAAAAVPLLCRRSRAVFSLLALIAVTLLLAGANLALFAHGVRLALAYPLLTLLVLGAAESGRQVATELREVRRTRRMLSSYLSERVVDQLVANPELARLGGERREATVLFSDIRGFTGFSERHRPEEVVATLNEHLGAMTEVVFHWEGTLDKFIGDSVMAFWNAPSTQRDHAERALRCALEMCDRLDRLNAAWAAAGRPAFEVGIGINTGTVIVGNVGVEGKKMDYTVIGDQVNLCARIEDLTKRFGARILVAASTIERLQPVFAAGGFGHVDVVGPETVPVRGKVEPVRVYRVTPREHTGRLSARRAPAGRRGGERR